MIVKYSIILPYFFRPSMRKAFMSFKRHYAARKDFEVLVVEAPQNHADPVAHREMVQIISDHFGDFKVGWIVQNFRDTMCPGTAYNYGVRQSTGEYIVISNPECVHQSDVLAGFDEGFAVDPGSYQVAACMSLDAAGKPHTWYQHGSTPRDHKLNHCTAISRANYSRVGGFDEAFADGYARTDIDFVWAVMNAGIPIVERDDLVTLHLHHERSYGISPQELRLRMNKSVARLRAKWEGVHINYDQEWVKRVQKKCW